MRQQNQSSGVLATDDAIIWIIKNQFGRRNLSAYDRSILALKLKPVIAAKAKENQGERTDLISNNFSEKSRECFDELKPVKKRSRKNRTDDQIAKAAGVSENTIRKVEKIEQQASPEIKAESLSVRTKYPVGKNLFAVVVVALIGVFVNQRR